MTYTSRELAAKGVDPVVIEFRRWRRRQKLSYVDVAKVLDVSSDSLMRFELGDIKTPRARNAALLQRMTNLMACWREDMRPARERPDGRRGRKAGSRVVDGHVLKPLAKCDEGLNE